MKPKNVKDIIKLEDELDELDEHVAFLELNTLLLLDEAYEKAANVLSMCTFGCRR